MMQNHIVVPTKVTTILIHTNLKRFSKMTLSLVKLTKRITTWEAHTGLDVSFFIYCNQDLTIE